MKIRFTSPRTTPEDDQGTRVPYAPAKRQAFKLRWYLLMALVASPFLYALWLGLNHEWKIEAPGYITLPVHDIIAPQNAIVTQLAVNENSTVQSGQLLLQLRRPELDSQIRELETIVAASVRTAPAPPPVAVVANSIPASQRQYIENLTNSYRKLFAQGAATRAELNEAEARLAAIQARPAAAPPPQINQDNHEQKVRLQAQLSALEEQRAALQIATPLNGRVLNLYTRNGLPVQQGQKLLTLQENGPLKIIALLPPQNSEYARANQQATIVLPNGQQLAATVMFNGQVTEAVPEILRVLGTEKQGIVLQLKSQTDIPPALRLNNLPVTIRFTRHTLLANGWF